MATKRGPWYPISIAIVLLNLAGGVFAWLTNELMHGFVHGAFAFGFGLLAWHLHNRSAQAQQVSAQPDRVALLEADRDELERELRETKERLDFADQLLKKKPPTN